MKILLTKYFEATVCISCDKPDKECVELVLESYAGPHCARCVMREAKKRANGKSEGMLFDGAGAK